MYLLPFLLLILILCIIYCKTKVLEYIHCNSNERGEYIEHINLDEQNIDHNYF